MYRGCLGSKCVFRGVRAARTSGHCVMGVNSRTQHFVLCLFIEVYFHFTQGREKVYDCGLIHLLCVFDYLRVYLVYSLEPKFTGL